MAMTPLPWITGWASSAPEAPVLTIIEDADNDGYINDDELDGDINYTIALGAGTRWVTPSRSPTRMALRCTPPPSPRTCWTMG
ncbi:hypothetical protein [Grimontia sp. NTOU-MAR1]|uniref:hypothetical protein n=1 Tax=Grimontia sp. NTOU-MAR1 TaxID=3111011 RepID=UPI002DB79973|nr:hypothetical protein [Grimontia sp. NTOU-MAR1]WRV96228.1 hypothetical protein VP504_00090 [Grimontia sp. NTOU-MAR1]